MAVTSLMLYYSDDGEVWTKLDARNTLGSDLNVSLIQFG